MRRVLAVLAVGLLSLAPVAAMAQHRPPHGGGGGARSHGPMEHPADHPGPPHGGGPHYPAPAGYPHPGGVVVVPGRPGGPYARPGGRMSLDGVISQMHRRFPGGRMLDAGVENHGGREVYRVRWATGDGRRVDYLVDAQTGAIVGVWRTDLRVLLAEDDPDLARQLKQALGDVGYAVDNAADGEEAHFLGDTEPYDVIVLDLGLPKIDGVSVLERWRREGRTIPVLILTARGAWSDKVSGFDAGADDYLTKPFHTEELLARLRALVRRAAGHAAPSLSCGGLRLDPRAARATVAGEPLRLTSLEYRLLHYLMMHQGRVISRTELVEHLYDQDFDRDSNTIEVFVGRLRKKIGPDRIETVRGLGYRLVPLAGEPAEA